MGELGKLPLFMNIINSSSKYIIHMDADGWSKTGPPIIFSAIEEDKLLGESKTSIV